MLSKKDKSAIATTVIARLGNAAQQPSIKKKKKNKKVRTPGPGRNPSGAIDYEQVCLNDYAKVVADPFTPGLEPCAPFTVTRPSDKYKVFGRVAWNAGTTGFGFCSFDPYKAYNNSVSSIYATTASSVGGNTTALSAFTLLTATVPSVSPVPPDINVVSSTAARVRVVAAAIRTRCSHAPLSTQGDLVSYTVRNNTTAQAMFPRDAFGDLGSQSVSATALQQGDYIYTQWFPADVPDEDFFETASAFPTSTVATQGPLVCVATGAVAGQSYVSEFIGYYEYVSVLAGGHSSKSAASPDSANKILDFFATSPSIFSEYTAWFANASVNSVELGSRAYIAIQAARNFMPGAARRMRAINQ